MALNTRIKSIVNHLVRPLGVEVRTTTADRIARRKLERLSQDGYFDRPAFPLPAGFADSRHEMILAGLKEYRARLQALANPADNSVGYSFQNNFFSSPDAEVLYTVVRQSAPARVVEVGSGSSTKVARQAIIDGQLKTQIVCIDPQPRLDVAAVCDRHIAKPVEAISPEDLVRLVGDNSVLFIDSSHTAACGEDVPHLFCKVLPLLPAGTLVHVHDILIPYDYPSEWVLGWARGWNEQYLVLAMLLFSEAFEVLWPGYYLQRTLPRFADYFIEPTRQMALSLWLRKR